MKRVFSWTAVLFLAACSGGPSPVLDAKKFLADLEGPKVPTVQDTMTESARVAEAEGNFVQAAAVYQQILQRKPGDKAVQLSLADALRRSGEYDRSIALYDDLLKKEPASAAAKEGKGLALMGKGDFDAPTPLFEEVVKAEPTRWKTLNALGILFTTRNMHPEAQQYFKEALKHNPSSVSVLNNLGLSQALDRDFNAAAGSLLQASALTQPGSVERKRVDMNLALAYAVAGKLEDAKMITERYYTGAALNNNMGLYAHLAKDDDLARSYLNMALTESKTFYEKAWDNLQALDTNTSATSAPKRVKVEEIKPSAGKTEKPKKEAVRKAPKAEEKKTDAPVEKTDNVMPAPAPVQDSNGLGAIVDSAKEKEAN